MSSMINTIGRGTAWTTAGTLGVKLAGLLATFITLHTLTVYEYGLTELAVSIIPLLSIFVLPGISAVVQAEMSLAKASGDGGRERALFEEYFWVQLLLSLIPWAGVFFGASLISSLYNEGIANMFRIVSFAFLLSPFRAATMLLFRTNLRFKVLAAYGVSEELFKFCVLLLCYFVFDLRAVSVIIAYILSVLLTLVLFSFQGLKEYRGLLLHPRMSGHHPFIRLMREHGKWGMATNYLNNFSNNIRLWIIKAFLGADAVGLFSLASSLFSHAASLIQINGVIAPILPRYVRDGGRLARLVSKSMKYQLAGFLVSAVGTSIAFPILIMNFFPQFAPALPLFFIIIFTMVPSSISSILTVTFTALQAQRELFFATLIKTLSIVLVAPPLIMAFGVYGIAIEFFVTAVIFTLERYRVMGRLIPGFQITPNAFMHMDEDDRLILSKGREMMKRFIS